MELSCLFPLPSSSTLCPVMLLLLSAVQLCVIQHISDAYSGRGGGGGGGQALVDDV